jgi:hypothetical protein
LRKLEIRDFLEQRPRRRTTRRWLILGSSTSSGDSPTIVQLSILP